MFVLTKSKTKQSNRQQIAIEGIKDGILQLPGHQYRIVLEVSSLNFELRSEEEQDAIIETYEGFLNSVDTSLQILVRTRQIDLDKYLEQMRHRLEGETEAIYRTQLENYHEFIRSLVTTNTILSKRFYVVVPFDAVTKTEFAIVWEQLQLKADIITKGLLRLGIHTTSLSSLEVLDLFYTFYSPAQAKQQPLTDQALQLIHTTIITRGVHHE